VNFVISVVFFYILCMHIRYQGRIQVLWGLL